MKTQHSQKINLKNYIKNKEYTTDNSLLPISDDTKPVKNSMFPARVFGSSVPNEFAVLVVWKEQRWEFGNE